MIRVRVFGTAMLLSWSSGVTALAQADTIPRHPMFTWKDAAILEAFAIATVAVAPLDTRIAQRLQNPAVQENQVMNKTAGFVRAIAEPGSVIIGLGMYAYGRLANNPKAADLGLHGTEALLIGAEVGSLIKGLVGRARPYMDVNRPHDYKAFRGFGGKSDYKSFPSGHTIAAFAAAAAVTSETSRWWPRSVWYIAPVMYGGATAVGLSRMFNNQHWASDVITGAAIGTFAGLKVVQWQHMNPGNDLDRIFLGANVQGSTISLSLAPGH